MIRTFACLALFAAACFVQPAPASTGPAPGGGATYSGAEPYQDPQGGNMASGELPAGAVATCPGGNLCNWECEGGGCDLTCAGGSTCNIDCEGGGCRLACAAGAVCNLDCEGGACEHACAYGSTCNIDE